MQIAPGGEVGDIWAFWSSLAEELTSFDPLPNPSLAEWQTGAGRQSRLERDVVYLCWVKVQNRKVVIARKDVSCEGGSATEFAIIIEKWCIGKPAVCLERAAEAKLADHLTRVAPICISILKSPRPRAPRPEWPSPK